MKTLAVTPTEWSPETDFHFASKRVMVKHELDSDTVIEIDGIPVLMRRTTRSEKERGALISLRHLLLERKWTTLQRTNGQSYPCVSWGFLPPEPLGRRAVAGPAQAEWLEREMTSLAWSLTQWAWEGLRRDCRDLYTIIEGAPLALPCWRIGETPWTSGVLNGTTAMPYHKDKGNEPHTGSAMWVMRDKVSGGHLHIPELDTVVMCPHGTLLIFFGDMFWHGVTQINNINLPGAARYSMVAYAKRAMLNKPEPGQEYERGIRASHNAAMQRRDTVLG